MEPASFGGFAFGLIVITMLDGVLGSAIDVGVLRRLSESSPSSHPEPIEIAGIAIKTIAGLSFLLLSLAAGTWVAQMILDGSSPGFFPVTSVVACSLFLFRSLQVYHQARFNYRRFATLELLHVALRCALVIGYLFTESPQPERALILFCIPPFLLVAIAGNWMIRPSTWKRLTGESVRDLLVFIRETLAATATGAFSSRLDVMSAGWILPTTELGRFTAATTLTQVPEIAATYVSGALAPLILPHVQQGTFLRWFRRITAGGVAACLGVLLCIPFLITAFGGILPQKYNQSLDLIRILLPGYLASALIFPVALNFLLFHQPRIFVRYDLITFPFLLFAYYWSGKLFGIVGIAWASSINRLLKAICIHIFAFTIARRKTHLPPVT